MTTSAAGRHSTRPGGTWRWSAARRQTARRAPGRPDKHNRRRSALRGRALPALLELGDEVGVVPEVELWGGSKTLHRLGEAALVAIESGHKSACILPDVYHLYKGGFQPPGSDAA